MPIRPIDIRRKEFKSGFRGYDANQVDDFLDAVADEFERNYTENQRMREEVSSLRDRLQQFEDLEGSIRAALVHAEQASNDLRRAASSEAEDLRQSAQREADFTIREAQTRAHQMLADSSSRIERVQDSYEALQEAKKSFTNDFRHLLKTYTDMMDSMEASSAKQIEAARQEEARPPEDSDIGVTSGDEGEHTDPGLTISEQEIAESEEEVIVSTETGEVDPEATRLIETETVISEEPISEEELAAADVVPEQSEAQEETPLSEEQPTEVLSAEDLGPFAEAPEEPPAQEVEPSTPEDETQQFEEPPVSEPAEEVEVNQEETSLAEERSSEVFFEREQAEQDDSRVFRASRFLRRRE
jgi:cell division initiation protein